MPKRQPLGELMLFNILCVFCHLCPCCTPPTPSEPQLTPASPGDPPRLVGRSSPSSYGVTVLGWVPVYVKPCGLPPRVESLFPPVCGTPVLKYPGLQSQMLWGFLLLMQDPHTGEADVGFRTLILLGEPLQYIFQFVGQVWDGIMS